MTLFIQRAAHRDTQAIQAKLDELLKANRDAENAITRVDETEPKEIEDFREGSGGGFDSSRLAALALAGPGCAST